MSRLKLEEAWRLHRAGEHQKAERLYRDVISADPSNYEALHRLAFLHGQRGQWEDAQSLMARAIRINPRAPDAEFLRGTALQKLERHEEAVACFNRALALNPALAEVRLNRAASLYRLRRYEEAGDDYSRILELAPDYPFARGNRLFCRLQCCDWRALESEAASVIDAMRAGKRILAPFDAKALLHSAEDELICARIWAADQYGGPIAPHANKHMAHSVPRVAYVSADFRNGPLATLMTGVFERHDQKRIETIGVSSGLDDGSTMRRRFEQSFGQFIDVGSRSDIEIASLLRRMEVDIAVDLMGYTEGGRPGIFKHRPVPIQVNYLGYPGTTGGDWLDYLIADRVVVPEDQAHAYAEQIVYLPGTFLPRDTSITASSVPITRADEGLPPQSFVFACFNNAYKINPIMFDIWMHLLLGVEGSILWLTGNNRAMPYLAREAEARGVARDRLIFAPFRKLPEDHLARLRLADLFLDTLPYNAHTTASDALWAGVPVLTCIGRTFAGRVGASLLQSLEIPELITHSLDEYETVALRLASDESALRAIRDRLERLRTTRPTFDQERFARDLETAYLMMWERYQRGEPPDHFAVPALA